MEKTGNGELALLFDLDGTLTDAKPGITRCIQYALTQLGRTAPTADALNWCVGPPLADSFAQLLQTEDAALIEQAVLFYREQYSTGGLFENALYPDIPQTLDHLRSQGYRLFVATAKPQVYAIAILEHFHLAALFDGIYGSELAGQRSHKGDLIQHIIQQETLTAHTTVMIGDRQQDILGAKQNQMRAIGVTYGYGTLDELQTHGADWIAHTPSDIPAVLLTAANAFRPSTSELGYSRSHA